MQKGNELKQVATYHETDDCFVITIIDGDALEFKKRTFPTFSQVTDKWWRDFVFEDGKVYVKDRTIQITSNGLKFRSVIEVNPDWNDYDKLIAECFLRNGSPIYVDLANGKPIDNEHDVESIYDLIKLNAAKAAVEIVRNLKTEKEVSDMLENRLGFVLSSYDNVEKNKIGTATFSKGIHSITVTYHWVKVGRDQYVSGECIDVEYSKNI